MTVTDQASFGAGGSEPYARALRTSTGALFLHEEGVPGPAIMDLAKWNADADLIDLTLLSGVTGPVLDVGCGPGRMVRAAADLGLAALGIDVSTAAVEVARDHGTLVIEASVFDALPGEGTWQTVLLVDGNIGIGGDVGALIRRCAELCSIDGEIVVEVDPDPDRHRTYEATLVDAEGRESRPFPWAEIGVTGLGAIALDADLTLRQSWVLGERSFCRLAVAR